MDFLLTVLCFFAFVFLMRRRSSRSTCTDTLLPYTTLFRSGPRRTRAADIAASGVRAVADSRRAVECHRRARAGGNPALDRRGTVLRYRRIGAGRDVPCDCRRAVAHGVTAVFDSGIVAAANHAGQQERKSVG